MSRIMSTPPTYVKYPPREYTNKLEKISRALTVTKTVKERFKKRLQSEGIGSGVIERKEVLELLWILDRQRKITSDKPDVLVQILRDIDEAELILEEFPEFHVPAPTTVSEDDLDWLASQMGPEWESFARQQLKIPQRTIYECKVDVYPVNLREQVFKVLAEWKRRQGEDATYAALTRKLLEREDFKKLAHDWRARLHPI